MNTDNEYRTLCSGNTFGSPICSYCVHLDRKKWNRSCKAYDIIPSEIWNGKNDHTKPYPGDKGILFELDPRFKNRK